MIAYADTNFVASLYLPGVQSPRAQQWLRRNKARVWISDFHALELTTAILALVQRKDLLSRQAHECLNAFRSDSKVFHWCDFKSEHVFPEAMRITEKLNEALGMRTLDVIHLAAAHIVGATHFLSFDQKAAQGARALGMKVNV